MTSTILVRGEWRPAGSGRAFPVRNPATGEGGRYALEEFLEVKHVCLGI